MNKNDIPYGVGVLVVKDGKFLCGLRSDTGEICGPGGHVEKDEDPRDAAIRETREEFGVTPKDLKMIGCLKSPDGAYLPTMVFLCTDFEGEPKADGTEMVDEYFGFNDISDLEQRGGLLYPAFDDSISLLEDCIKGRVDGGAGSGNWGHSGRPGMRGGSGGGGGYKLTDEDKISKMVSAMSSDEKKLFSKANEDSKKAVKNLNDTYASNKETWDKASKAVAEGKQPVTATAAAKDHTIPGASKEAQEAYDAIRAKEPQISKDMIEIAGQSGSEMYGLDFSVKTGKSIASKINRIKNKPENREKTDAELVNGMGDLVRYTQLTDHNNIAAATKSTVDQLKKKGYTVNEVDNKYNKKGSDYKGVHIGAVSPSGQQIELQIHSKQSMKVKETIHPMYDVSRENSGRVKNALKLEMKDVSSTLADPDGISSIKSWKKK